MTLSLLSKLCKANTTYSSFNKCLLKFSTSSTIHSELDYFSKLKQSTSEIIFDKSRPDKITVIALNRQSKKNALSAAFVKDMRAIFDEVKHDQSSSAVVICSLVDKVFCAGADLKERAQVPNSDVSSLVSGLRSLFQKLYDATVPVIAGIDGHALGGGLELALACDLRYVTDLPGIKIGLVESHWGLLPGAGGSQRLPRLIGASKALELMYRAKTLDGPEALKYGIVNAVANHKESPDPTLAAALMALEVAKEISTKGPVAIKMIKKAVQIGMPMHLNDGLDLEGQCYEVLIPTNDRQEGMKAFAEKRKPIYKGE